MGATTGRFTVSLTNITAEFLRETGACEEGVEWYAEHPEIHDAEWPQVCAALEEDGHYRWGRWVRRAVAKFGTTEDRVVLRNDSDAAVRWAVEHYGRNDPK